MEESNENKNFLIKLLDASIKGLPAFFGELGEPNGSLLFKGLTIFSLFLSILFLSVITAKITTIFIHFWKKGGRILKKTYLSSHIIICGWNYLGHKIVSELINTKIKKDIVILSNLNDHPLKDNPNAHLIEFVKGDPTQDEALMNAGIDSADTIIVLSDLTKNANEADSEALMISLAVKSLNNKIHVCVQIMNHANRIHLQRAQADEIISLDQLGANMVVTSAMNHGLSSVVRELLTFGSGNEFWRYDEPLSDRLVGKKFIEAVQILGEQNIILIGFETLFSEELHKKLYDDELHTISTNKKLIVLNPKKEYRLQRQDALFLISHSKPTSL